MSTAVTEFLATLTPSERNYCVEHLLAVDALRSRSTQRQIAGNCSTAFAGNCGPSWKIRSPSSISCSIMKNQPPRAVRSRRTIAHPDAGSQRRGTDSVADQSSASVVVSRPQPSPEFLTSVALLGVTFLWVYWPTFVELAHAWNSEPDYSHGYFVVPLALFFLWIRRDRMPAARPRLEWAVADRRRTGLHLYGSLYYLEPLHGWSMTLWLAGAAWLVGGRRFCVWSLPSTLFLLFMVPLPYGLEMKFRQPLQRIATEVSCWTLQSLGLPARCRQHHHD